MLSSLQLDVLAESPSFVRNEFADPKGDWGTGGYPCCGPVDIVEG